MDQGREFSCPSSERRVLVSLARRYCRAGPSRLCRWAVRCDQEAQHNNTTTRQHNNATTRQHNNTTTQQHNTQHTHTHTHTPQHNNNTINTAQHKTAYDATAHGNTSTNDTTPRTTTQHDSQQEQFTCTRHAGTKMSALPESHTAPLATQWHFIQFIDSGIWREKISLVTMAASSAVRRWSYHAKNGGDRSVDAAGDEAGSGFRQCCSAVGTPQHLRPPVGLVPFGDV